jgi:hypothetical protein
VHETRVSSVSPIGGTVYVTGESQDNTNSAYATIAYNATTGAQQWLARYNGPSTASSAAAVAVSPTTGTVYVTGRSSGKTSSFDYATVAYHS